MCGFAVGERKNLCVNVYCRFLLSDKNLFVNPAAQGVAGTFISVIFIGIGVKFHTVIYSYNIMFVFGVKLSLFFIRNNVIRRRRDIIKVCEPFGIISESFKRYDFSHLKLPFNSKNMYKKTNI